MDRPASWTGVLAGALAEPLMSDTQCDRSDTPSDRSLLHHQPDLKSPIPSIWCPCGDLDELLSRVT